MHLARCSRRAKRQAPSRNQSKVRLPPPEVVDPKLKQDFDEGRAILISGGAADLLLSPCPGMVMTCDDPEASIDFCLAVAPDVTHDFAARLKRVQASASTPVLAHVNFDSQLEQILQVQKDFLEANAEVKEKYKDLVEETTQSNEKIKKLKNGSYSLCFANQANHCITFVQPNIMALGLKEDVIQKLTKCSPPAKQQKIMQPGQPHPSPFDKMQKELKEFYMARGKPLSVVPWKRMKQCGTAVENAEAVKIEVAEMVDQMDYEVANLIIYADGDAEDLYPD